MYSITDVVKELQEIAFFSYSKDFYGVFVKDNEIHIRSSLIPLNSILSVIKKAEESGLLLYLHYDFSEHEFFITWRRLHDNRR